MSSIDLAPETVDLKLNTLNWMAFLRQAYQ